MSFFEELKRRNVVKVADVLFDAIGTPEWVMQTMLVFPQKGSDPISASTETAATATEKLDPTPFEREQMIAEQRETIDAMNFEKGP
ncbi:MAG: hypothetical protein HKN58_07380 [Xanthomonadales bacterium]|nr:hypothetical protein [Xanthomonadales bacterium]